MAELAKEAGIEEEVDLSHLGELVEDAPIVKLVNMLITQAVQDRASDIHIEPQEKDIRVRYRIDGVLHEVMRTQKSVQSGLISRLKIMADINIAERRIPQDGRVSLTVNQKPIDLRVATLPTAYGEKLVLRILYKAELTFSTALRSILRSEPNIVLIGEIRDTETAKIAMEAAMTGHLVLSTLHTNDAPTALTRLPEMGVEAFLVASAVDCVLA